MRSARHRESRAPSPIYIPQVHLPGGFEGAQDVIFLDRPPDLMEGCIWRSHMDTITLNLSIYNYVQRCS